MNTMPLKFAEKFFWGSAISAHQTEGNNANSDWWAWEQSAKRISDLKKAGKNPTEYQSGMACDFYHRYEQDFDLVAKLHQNAFRLSIEWARIEPQEGRFDQEAVEHYKKVIASLRQRNIEPFVTLFHFSLPAWVARKGGFASSRNIQRFARYASFVARALPEVKYWATVNEPMVYALMAYLAGVFPPQSKNIFRFFSVVNILAGAHRAAYSAIKKHSAQSRVGIAQNIILFEPYKDRSANRALKGFLDWLWNDRFLDKISDIQDFVGVNYYFHKTIGWSGEKKTPKKMSDRGWELHPQGIYEVLYNLKKYRKPIYILEHGLADEQDEYRTWYIRETLRHVHRAIGDGVDVRGYFHWSLLDNFEWEDGYKWKFGLCEVDFATQERKPRPSAYEYAKICKANALDEN